MRYFLSILVAVAWALWFGGLVGMFLFINRLFESMKGEYRSVFDEVAPHQFTMAERFSLVAGALALLATFGLRLLSPRRALTGLFCILAAAAVLAVLKPGFITQKMTDMVHPGATPTAEVRKLHGLSMMASTVEAVLLLLAGAFLPAALDSSTRDGKQSGMRSEETRAGQA